jgi:hypothetical protein
VTDINGGPDRQTPPRTRKRDSHIWEREAQDWYREPAWCSERLFQVEEFDGPINDPACGLGTIIEAASRAGFDTSGGDLVDRGYDGTKVEDFLTSTWPRVNIVSNPPFDIAARFVRHALDVTARKVAVIFPTARLNAANGPKGKYWIRGLPLRRVWLMTPRPSMPPGHVIAGGKKASGGRPDFCWLIFEKGWEGSAELRWLHRDSEPWWPPEAG